MKAETEECAHFNFIDYIEENVYFYFALPGLMDLQATSATGWQASWRARSIVKSSAASAVRNSDFNCNKNPFMLFNEYQ